jgi:type I restriction enzyme, S subunit
MRGGGDECLPNDWQIRPFEELNQFSSSTVDPSAQPDQTFELYSVPSFPTGKPEQVLGSAIGSTKQTVAPGDVLISKINPRINRVWTVGAKTDMPQIASSEWIGFRSEAVQAAYANYYFQSPAFRDLLCSEVAGVGGSLTRAQPKRVAAYPVSVAPIAEQTRIANQLDTLLARIQACQDRLDAIPALLKRFRQAVLGAAVIGDLLDGPPHTSFLAVPLGSVLAEPLRNGKSVRDGDGLPVLRLTSLKAASIKLTETKTGDWAGISDIKRFLIRNGDFLVSRGNGSKELVGRGGLVVGCSDDIAFPDTMIRMRPDKTRLLPDYLKYAWSSLLVRKQIERTAKTTAGIWKVAQPDLERVLLPLPGLKEQAEIVRRVEALFKFVDRIEAHHAAASAKAQRLRPLTLTKAFRGELLPQNPNDEPASALLTNLRAARTEAAADPSRKRPKTPDKRLTKTNADKDSIRAAILKLNTDRFSFDELAAQIAGDYESLKRALFELLEGPNPAVRQVFDEKAKAMLFVRVKP